MENKPSLVPVEATVGHDHFIHACTTPFTGLLTTLLRVL